MPTGTTRPARRRCGAGLRTGACTGILIALAACTINPVTGSRELALVSADQEIAIGTEQYGPSRQMQGGDYVRDPALVDYVRGIGRRLAGVSDRALPYEFVVLNNSIPNAWALPGGKIAVDRGLLTELDNEAELAAVLGHEIVHAAARHGAQAIQRGLLTQGALVVAATATRSDDYAGIVLGAAGLGAQLINSRYGRQDELEADRYGMVYMSRAGYDPAAAVTLQETFLRLSQDRASTGWIAGLFATHPPSAERVARNRETALTLPSGGELGRERYAAAVAGLRAAEPAYAAYDRGRRALTDGDLTAAAAAANEALGRIDDEGHFHALLGDVERARGSYAAAVDQYRRSIELNGGYFNYHLGKARAHQALGQLAEAEAEFDASNALLPTADAYLGLGQIAERSGDLTAAIDSYRRAAGADSPAGSSAREAMVRLDLPQNPGQYLSVAGSIDAGGRLVATIANPTPFAVTDLVLRVRYVDSANRAGEVTRTIATTVPPGASLPVATGIGSLATPQSFELTLVSAAVVAN